MDKFNIGDKVVRTEESADLGKTITEMGKVYTVCSSFQNPEGGGFYVSLIEHHTYNFDSSNFKKASTLAQLEHHKNEIKRLKDKK